MVVVVVIVVIEAGADSDQNRSEVVGHHLLRNLGNPPSRPKAGGNNISSAASWMWY